MANDTLSGWASLVNEDDLVEWGGLKAHSSNIPRHWAGSYLIINLVTGGIYVGISWDIAERLRYRYRQKSEPKLSKAFQKYHRSSFLVFPIFYLSSGDESWLPVLEAELIAEYDSVSNGYNIKEAAGGVGPYGEEFGARMRESMAVVCRTPEFRAKMSAIATERYADPANRKPASEEAKAAMRAVWERRSAEERAAAVAGMQAWLTENRDDEFEARRLEAVTAARQTPKARAATAEHARNSWADAESRARRVAALNDPANIARLSVAAAASMADPEVKARHAEATRAAMADPEVRAKLQKPRRVGIWVNDGTINRRLAPGASVPDGWRPGRQRGERA